MKLGIKKLGENEWQLHIDNAFVHLDRYSLELLYSNLEQLLNMGSGQEGTVLAGLLKLSEKLLELNDSNLQLFLREVEHEDLLALILATKNQELKDKIIQNVGGIMSKQLQADMDTTATPPDDEAITSIKHTIEILFELETTGKVEFINKNQRFI